MTELILYPYNRNKKLEAKYISKFIDIGEDTELKIKIINHNIKENINKEIIKSYNEKPDLLIIKFDADATTYKLNKLPKYPIYISKTFYITPICIQQVNGFSNENDIVNDVENLINDFIERILIVLGAIMSNKNFVYPKNNSVNLDSGIKSLMYKGIKKEWFINDLSKWLTRYIPINPAGWFSNYNKIALDYVFENYKDFGIFAELGAYYGLSSRYIAENCRELYCFDDFRNVMLADYTLKKITPLDTKYFLKYQKFESFHANLAEFPNVISVKLDCFKSIDFLKKYDIKVDVFYIDFCKKDNILIKFVNHIFDKYPDCIIVGDDAVLLSSSLEYFKKNYNYTFMHTCYICSKNTKLVNLDSLQKKINEEYRKQNNKNINEVKNFDDKYKINYVTKLISNNNSYDSIINALKTLKINPNQQNEFIAQNGNIFHFIGYNYLDNTNYYSKLYKKINDYIKDKNRINNFNLTPTEYIKFGKYMKFF
jgi:hypothetical protein